MVQEKEYEKLQIGLAELVSNYGTGDQLRLLNALYKSSKVNIEAVKQYTKFKHDDEDFIRACNLDIKKIFEELADIQDDCITRNKDDHRATMLMEKVIQNEELKEKLAIVCIILLLKIPNSLINIILQNE